MQISINNWKLDPSLNALIHCETGEVQRLGEFHFILLDTLATHAGEVLTRNLLINEVWKNRVVGNNSLPTAIYALRVALGDDGRLQEIIKTIPKKGYMLNKDFIVETDNGRLPEKESATLTDVPLTSIQEEDAVSILEHNALSFPEETHPPQASSVSDTIDSFLPDSLTPSQNKKGSVKKTKTLIILCVLLFVSILAGLLFHSLSTDKKAPINIESINSGLNIYQETTPENGRMKIFHLHRGNVDKKNELLITHVRETLSHINQLLLDRNATLTIYYYNTIPKLSVDILLKNHCEKEYQLIMGIDNWQSNTNALGTLIYQEVERTLNEMPTCN
ncbi:CadC family transcriptional regulator [Enterobacteriaceae bacterium RIT711]|nr:CadC family transcriptional regulator [Enterobacteriaceae bacterium RIT711]